MKAVGVLICLALAEGISANILKRSHRPADLVVQPYDYINQYQQPYFQPQDKSYQQYIKSQLKHQKQKYQYSGSSSHESSQESSERISHQNEQEYVPVRAPGQKWNTPLFTAVMKVQDQVDPVNLNDIMWSRSLQIPVTRDSIVVDQKKIEKIFAAAQKSMKHPTEEEKVKFHEAFVAAEQAANEDAHLNATELLKKYNYPVEEHTIKTEDGYYLTLFRIPAKKQQVRDVTKKPVVFLMHGLLGSADDWLLMGPGKALAYQLSDAGYEVWLGNARGNKYSRRHVVKHPALNDFWQFGNDEVALMDLPAMIDYALQTSEQEKLQYVGYSLGTTAFFALAAARPEYNDKIIMMHALAPMVYMKGTRSPLFRMIAPNSPFAERLRHQIGHGAFEPTEEFIDTVGGAMLASATGCKNVSSNVNFVMSGVNIEGLTPEMTPVIMQHVPAGASTRMVKQFAQATIDDEFRKYDFGAYLNQQVYGAAQPPTYPLQQVRVPVRLYYSEEDWLALPADVLRLQQVLPTSSAYKVPDLHFSHMDFQFSPKAPELVYKHLIETINSAY